MEEKKKTCKFCGEELPPGMHYCCKLCYYEFEEIPINEEDDEDEYGGDL